MTLVNGEVITYLGNGLLEVTPGSLPRDVTAEVTYSIINESGITDTATLTIETSPVQGAAANDHIVGFTDLDGTQVDGADGPDDVILGYGAMTRFLPVTGTTTSMEVQAATLSGRRVEMTSFMVKRTAMCLTVGWAPTPCMVVPAMTSISSTRSVMWSLRPAATAAIP